MHNIKQKLLELDIVIDNQFLDKYVELIIENLNTIKIKYQTQQHHIIPNFYYKHQKLPCNNDPSNIVYLLYSNHVLAHYYLAKCAKYRDFRDGNMCAVRYVTRKFNIGSKERDIIEQLPIMQQYYEEAKHIRCINNDTPAKISATLTGRKCMHNLITGKYTYVDPEYVEDYIQTGEWIVEHMRHSEETRKHLSHVKLGRKAIHKDGQLLYVYKNVLQEYLDKGWKLGNPFRKTGGNKGKISIVKDGKCIFIDECELARYIDEGWIRGNRNTGRASALRGSKFTESHKQALSASRKGRIALNKDNKIIYINPENADTYIKDGWQTGGLKKPGTGYATGRICINNGEKCKFILPEELDIYIANSWVKGKIYKNRKRGDDSCE